MNIITISREFGSGGREVAKRLSDELHIAYYDREIITAIAKETELDEGYVAHTLESGLRNNYPLTFSHTFTIGPLLNIHAPHLLAAQNKLLRELAEKEDCIIVGRGADAVLQEFHPFRIFVYADMPAKILRCRHRAPENEHLTDKQMERRIREIDRVRAQNHALVSDLPWGDKHSYDLCLNTTTLDIKAAAPLLAAYVKQWFALNR
ncbi:MAG: cytidylate kinase-like family protein [Clostridia bacterium]|nr:cytidylate kinase-like family protein [Clostridia bacterium]